MDEIEIAALVYRSAEHVDRGQPEQVAELFRHARLKLNENDDWLEAEELENYWQAEVDQRHGRAPSQQLVTNLVIDIGSGKNTASCRSAFVVLSAPDGAQVQVESAGHFRDEFVKVDGVWRFVAREKMLLGASRSAVATPVLPAVGKSEQRSPTKAKILVAARQIFSTVGYSEAGIRKIADLVGLSPTILFRHFGTKAALFEEALVQAMGERGFTAERENFGLHVADMLADPKQVSCPHSMTVLATGNEEARQIVAKVMQKYAIEPMATWLGPPDAMSRAREIMALCAGFVLYHSQLNATDVEGEDSHMVEWLATTLQAIVDRQ